MVRNIMAIVLGLVAGSVVNMAIVSLSHVVFPLPEGVDPNDFEAFKEHITENGMPTGALLLVLTAHAGGSLMSGFVCGLVAQRTWYVAAGVLGAVWMCAGIYMLTVIPVPAWFAISDVLLYIPAALMGMMFAGMLVKDEYSPSPVLLN